MDPKTGVDMILDCPDWEDVQMGVLEWDGTCKNCVMFSNTH